MSYLHEINELISVINNTNNLTIENIIKKQELLKKISIISQNECSELTKIKNKMLFDYAGFINKLIKPKKHTIQFSKFNERGLSCNGWINRGTPNEVRFIFHNNNFSKSKEEIEKEITYFLKTNNVI